MTDTERISWLEANNCALGRHVLGQWRVVQDAQGGPGVGSVTGTGGPISVGDTLREAIDNGINAKNIPVPPP
jgi:hypothetical protein